MKYPRHKLSVVVVFALAVILPLGAGFWYLGSHKKATPAAPPAVTQSTTTDQPSAAALKQATVDTSDFSYIKPEDWAKLSADRLTTVSATSGIGHPLAPVSTFIVKTSAALPANDTDLKNSTLAELKKLTNFSLVSNTSIKVGGKSGQKFVYTFTDTDKTKVKQEMDVVPYKKTYFLLSASAESDFDKSSVDFGKIVTSFTFK